MTKDQKVWRKLNANTAYSMRVKFMKGASINDLAIEFGVSPETVWNVVNYETWVSAGPPRPPDWEPGYPKK